MYEKATDRLLRISDLRGSNLGRITTTEMSRNFSVCPRRYLK